MAGAAKLAVISQCLDGELFPASSVAHTLGRGSFTIPMMKRMGYRPNCGGCRSPQHQQGADNAACNESRRLPNGWNLLVYPDGKLIICAALPAILYFSGIFMGVHLEGKREKS